MWQGWITFLDGLWISIITFMPRFETDKDLLITSLVAMVFGFWASKDTWQGMAIGFFGFWLFCCSFTQYMVLPVNFLLSGLTIAGIGILLGLKNLLPLNTKVY